MSDEAPLLNAQKELLDLDIYQVMRAAGHIEALLGLGARTTFVRLQISC